MNPKYIFAIVLLAIIPATTVGGQSLTDAIQKLQDVQATLRWSHNNSFAVATVSKVVPGPNTNEPDRLSLDLLGVVSTGQMIPTKVEVSYYHGLTTNNLTIGPLKVGDSIFVCLNKQKDSWRVSLQEMQLVNNGPSLVLVTGMDDPKVSALADKIAKLHEKVYGDGN